MKDEITIQLSVEEINIILEALGNLPFKNVFQIVAKIQTQASEQLSEQPPAPPAGETG